jgi:type I restriction enzyme S subunit
MIPSDWEKDFRLGDACKIKHGFPFESKYMTTEDDPSLPIVVNIINFQYTGGFRFESTKVQRYMGDYPEEYILSTGDILLVMTCQTPNGEILGVPGRIPDDGNTFLHNQRMGLVSITNPEKLDLGFIYYIFLSADFNRHLFATATGAKILHTAPSRIENYRSARPPIEIQRKIAAILSAFDYLIETIVKRIRILDMIAQSVYNEWFVHFRYPGHENLETPRTLNGPQPKGWATTTLSTIVENVKEKEKAGDHLRNLTYIPIDCISKKKLLLDRVESGKEAKSSLIRFTNYDVLFGAMRSYFHKVAIAPSNGITRTTCFVLRPRSPLYYCYSVMTLFQESTVQYANSRSKGSTIPYAVWENGLADMPIILPDKNTLEEFNSIIMPIVEEIVTTHFKINILRNMRDILLPRLISGEIDTRKLNTV